MILLFDGNVCNAYGEKVFLEMVHYYKVSSRGGTFKLVSDYMMETTPLSIGGRGSRMCTVSVTSKARFHYVLFDSRPSFDLFISRR